MANFVTVHSVDATGAVQTITITQTGADKARTEVASSDNSIQSEDVKSVTADPAALTLACELDAFFLTGNILVVVQRNAADQVPVATITISHAIVGNGPHVFPLDMGDDIAVQSFLQRAAFPSLAVA